MSLYRGNEVLGFWKFVLSCLFLAATLVVQAAEVPNGVEKAMGVEVHASLLSEYYPDTDTMQRIENLLGIENIQADACCKHCRKGKACGNSCISKKKECTKPKGCACDG